MIDYIVFAGIGFIIGVLIGIITTHRNCDGDLVVRGDDLFLHLSNKDMKKIQSNNITTATLHIVRK